MADRQTESDRQTFSPSHTHANNDTHALCPERKKYTLITQRERESVCTHNTFHTHNNHTDILHVYTTYYSIHTHTHIPYT